MSAFAQQLDEADYEAEVAEAQAAVVRAEARLAAVRALHQYNSPLNRTITTVELDALRVSDTSEAAGVPGDLPAQEDSPPR
jgi:DNA-directed RNA polymerase specialized sigma24 family protein